MRFEGKRVWIGQISRDIGVRLTRATITTHKIDSDVDETREFLLEDLAFAQSPAKFGYDRGVGEAPYNTRTAIERLLSPLCILSTPEIPAESGALPRKSALYCPTKSAR
jgi:hypothetical protein